jgi:hypothetical protein
MACYTVNRIYKILHGVKLRLDGALIGAWSNEIIITV